MDDTSRAHEEDIFSMIRSSGNLAKLHGESLDDDGSQYLNEYGDGLEVEEEQIMFQNPEQLTMSDEVYILASGDHYMCIN
jgi:hypothetical protein